MTCVTGPWGHNFPVPVPTETCIEDGIRPVPLLNITADTVNLCPGDSLILFTGNAPGYLFQWFKNGMQISGQTDDSIIITASGIYKVRTSTTSNVTAFSPDLTVLSDTSQITLSVFTSSSTDSICPGDTAWLVNTYNNYSSIDWLRNDTLLPAGNGNDFFYVTQEGEYKILLTTAGGCPKYSDSVNIILYDTIRPLISMNGDTLSVSPIYQAYQWYYQGMLIPGATQNTYVTGANGDYYLVVSDFSGCSMISDTVTIVIVKNLNYPLSNTVIAKFYNKNLFILMNNSEAGKIEITLYNANGSLIHQSFHLKNALSFSVIIPLSKISYGIYLINIKTKKYSCIKKDAYLGQ
ncbi:MAG: T9SS type A sorting domain-containing protein [Bacteroidetes bacterium]|nr:T9SS type A sorting domain-containing protein [Bacteroidota bacterium]